MPSAVITCSRRCFFDRLREQQRQLDVLERGEHRNQVVELEDEADVPRAPRRERALGQPADVGVADANRAARRPIDAGQQVQQRRLARAGRPHQPEEVALGHRDGDVGEHRDLDRVPAIDLRHVADFDQSHEAPASGRRSTQRHSEQAHPVSGVSRGRLSLTLIRTRARSVRPAGAFRITASPGTRPLFTST